VLTLHRRFDTDALTPNYCFNNFAGLADGSAYEQDTSVTGAFAWKQPLFDPSTDATRYTYCLNDPLLPGQRDTFCKGGGYKVVFPGKPDRCTRANARARVTAASPSVLGAIPPRFVRTQLQETRQARFRGTCRVPCTHARIRCASSFRTTR
jgi:hypothetical protein